ncbi:DNA mismatch repair protein mutH [Candidatus Photodesmus katoptron]|uniref:DNA mismatch repair protein MutH n=1 Tax=Candidatus Photodesmus katoptron Akat1 TaxID=1236703 RepID=S3DFZ0_9GAMM|nr:DNA mismatch repair endonuclease MutH [Candidatus Photodesmus katoptron]EPE37297.1 DNA mismatch repair endonuclease MutH [Candidatus Photodesmus katoptron Akat1]KEY90032.1 DNA mismatch repair protein mutH [Candidatus Photodesmus katoptron]
MKTTPKSEEELFERARNIAGFTVLELAIEANMLVPSNLIKDKGWIGQLLEWHLGACSRNKPKQDFEHLGIELKSIPIGHKGQPLETTSICIAPLVQVHELSWEQSYLRKKISRILWIPVEGKREIPLSKRLIGYPILWSPSKTQELQLKTDWEEIIDMIALGQIEQITARHGEVLQLRPKAANSQVRTNAYGTDGKLIKTFPRGFYLRTCFTASILQSHFI